jgi:hypothetical protein
MNLGGNAIRMKGRVVLLFLSIANHPHQTVSVSATYKPYSTSKATLFHQQSTNTSLQQHSEDVCKAEDLRNLVANRICECYTGSQRGMGSRVQVGARRKLASSRRQLQRTQEPRPEHAQAIHGLQSQPTKTIRSVQRSERPG